MDLDQKADGVFGTDVEPGFDLDSINPLILRPHNPPSRRIRSKKRSFGFASHDFSDPSLRASLREDTGLESLENDAGQSYWLGYNDQPNLPADDHPEPIEYL